MNGTLAGKALRLRKVNEYKDKPKKYKHTYCVAEEGTEDVLYSCDVISHVASREVVFLDANRAPCFSMQPNRRIMPTYWLVTDASGREIGQIKQHVFTGGQWSGLGPSGEELFRIVNPESFKDKMGKTLLGGVTTKYDFVRGDNLLATTEQEPRKKPTKGGVRGLLQALITPSDWVIRLSEEAAHMDLRLVIPAMVLLIDVTVALDRAD